MHTLTPPQSQATQCPCPDLDPVGGHRPRVSMLGRAGMCHYFGWLGDSGPPGSGEHEGMYGGATTLIQMVASSEAPRCFGSQVHCPPCLAN